MKTLSTDLRADASALSSGLTRFATSIAAIVLVLSVATNVVGEAAIDSDQLNRSLRSVKDVAHLQEEIRKIGRSCRKHEFLKQMVFDADFPLEGRIALSRLLGNYGDDKMFSTKVLALPSNPESTKMKVALMSGFMERGAHLGFPADAVEKVAMNAEENEEVRAAAITWLILDVNRSDETLHTMSSTGELGPGSALRQRDVGRYRAVLDGIAGKAETPSAIKKMIRDMLTTSVCRTDLMKQNLRILQAKLCAAETAAKARLLPDMRRYQALLDVWCAERAVFQNEMLLLVELVQAYAAEHGGELPASIPQDSDIAIVRGPYRYFALASTNELSRETILLLAPRPHFFADGKTVFVRSGAQEVTAMSIADFNKALASDKGVELAPSMAEMRPVLYTINGEGKCVGYPRDMLRKAFEGHNSCRKQAAGTALIDSDSLLPELWSGVEDVEMPRSQSVFAERQ